MKTWILSLGVILLVSGCATVPEHMVKIPGGAFYMGTDRVDEEEEALSFGLPEPWYVDEHPYHKVKAGTVYMDRTEVTNAAYRRFVDTHPEIDPPDDWSLRRPPAGKLNHPVTYVSWFHADHYCKWLGGRLPTEAEWEKAARGTGGGIYPWGNTFDPEKANFSTGPFDRGRSRPVGATPAGNSPYGLSDMAGNVWEWVDGDYAPYPGNEAQVDAFVEGFKAMRGLSFEALGHFPSTVYHKVVAISGRASFRGYDHATSRLRDVGFRCAQDPS